MYSSGKGICTNGYLVHSQFGYLFGSIGLSQTHSTVLHLSSHSGFKALLFISAGNVIHSMKDEQDLRKLGGLQNLLPFTYVSMLIASFSLMALPYLSGNTSKDQILELSGIHVSIPGTFLWILGSLIAGLTAIYSLRLLSLTYWGLASGRRSFYEDITEQPLTVVLPMVLLTLLSIFYGYLAKEPLSGLGSDSLVHSSCYNNSYNMNNLVEAEFGLSFLSKNLPLLLTMLGILLGLLLNLKQEKQLLSPTLRIYFSNKWLLDRLFSRVLSWPFLNLGLFVSKMLDRGTFELLGPLGLTKTAMGYFWISPKENSPTMRLSPNTWENQQPLIKEIKGEEWLSNVPEYSLYIGLLAVTSMLLTLISHVLVNEILYTDLTIILLLFFFYKRL